MIKTISLILVLALGLSAEVANADFTFGEPTNLGPTVNTAARECFSTISSDGLELYFFDLLELRPGGLGGWDIWVTRRPSVSEAWGEPVNLGPPINTEYDDGKPSISADGLTLYFSSNRPGGYGEFDLWMSTRATLTDDWGAPVNLGEPVNSSADEIFPCVSTDGLELYFNEWAVFRPGGYGDSDIWVAKRATTDDPWGEPVNLGEAVNSSYYDSCPYLSPDGLMLFCHGWRPGGPGPEDIWVSTRARTWDAWGSTVPLSEPINSRDIDGTAGISADGCTFYFASFRGGGSGSADIWQAPILPVVDLNADGIVDSADMCIIVDHWGTDEPSCDIGPMPWGDGVVDVEDLKVLAEYLFGDMRCVAHFKLDEAKGSIANDSARNRDGIVQGGPEWRPTEGVVGGALHLDGVDDYVRTGFVLNPADGALSVFAWVKGGSPGQVVVAQKDGANWLLTDPSEGNLMTELKSAGRGAAELQSQTIITDGDWHRIGLVWDGSNRTLYVDDIAVAEDEQTNLAASENGLYIGVGTAMEPGSFWSGLIDDVRIYNRAVTP